MDPVTEALNHYNRRQKQIKAQERQEEKERESGNLIPCPVPVYNR